MLKAVFFDLNGVLIDSEYLSDRFEREYGISNGKFLYALKEIMEIVRKPEAPNMFSLWLPYLTEWGIDITEEKFLDFWFSGESVNQEVMAYSQELLSKKIKVFVVSNNFKERTEFYRFNFPEIFNNLSAAYFSWETGFVKPSKEAFEYVLKKHDLEPIEVVYFDDSEKNIAIAREIGLDGQLWSGLETAKKYINTKLE